MTDDERVSGGTNSPLSDGPLLDLLDALVESRGKVVAAQALGVNYRTMTNCLDSRRVSRRMRDALEKLRDEQGEAVVDDDGETTETVRALERRVAELEEENRELRELVEAQANRLEEMERQRAVPEERELQQEDTEGVDEEDGQGRQRGPSPVDAGVVSLEKRPGEDDTLGPAAALAAEWRTVRNTALEARSRVDRANAAVRRWEAEVELLRDFLLTLPPETEPLDDSRRADHIRWRREALAEARRELAKAVRIRWLRRAITLGVWWR